MGEGDDRKGLGRSVFLSLSLRTKGGFWFFFWEAEADEEASSFVIDGGVTLDWDDFLFAFCEDDTSVVVAMIAKVCDEDVAIVALAVIAMIFSTTAFQPDDGGPLAVAAVPLYQNER